MSEWISVKDRLPIEDGDASVIICINGVVQWQTARLCVDWWYWSDREADPCPLDRVSHWMPLPDSPK